MANKPTQPVFPLGLAAEEQSTLAGVLNTGTIEHGPDAVLTLPEGNASAGLPSSVRYNADSDEFEGFYENGGWLPLGGGGIRWEVLPHASTATLTEGRGYLINNTTGASTVVLPSPTRIGDSVTICDAYGKFATYPLTVSPSGNNLYGSTEDMAITTDNVSATFTWSGPEQGWIITSGVGLGQGRVYSREIFTKILASETSAVTLNTPPTIVDVYADGKRLAESKYSLDGNVITFSPSLPASTELQVIEYTPIQLGIGDGSGSSTITWVYNGGSAIGGETEITLDVVVDDVPAIDINGSRQYKNLGFTFDPLTSKITLAQELEPEDEVVVIINGTPNIYNQIDRTLQEVARATNVKDTEVVYFSVGAALSGYKVIYDKETQRAYPLPADIAPGTTAVSLSSSAVLVHSAGSVDLGELAVSREEYVTLSGTFDTGVTVNTKNELVVFTDGKYRWDGALPKTVPAGSTPEASGGVGTGAWVRVGDDTLRADLTSSNGAGLIGVSSGGTVQGSLSDIKNSIKHAQPLSDRRIVAIAHRGYSETYLEQTLMAYSQCNADVLEVDMQTTSDGYAVCFHDDDLSPATVGGSGAIKDNTYSTVSALRFTRAVGTRYADMAGIPTLGAVCRIAMRRGKMLHAEIKGYRTLADCTLYSSIVNQYGLSPYTTFSCFDFAPLAYTHNINPRITYALELNSYDSGMDANIAELASWGGSVLSINKNILGTIGNKKLREWEAMGLTLAAWTVYTAEQMQTVANYGIRLIYLDKDFYNIIG